MPSTKGHYGSLSRQLTQSRSGNLLPAGGALAGRGGFGMGRQVVGAGVDIQQGLQGFWARLAQGCGRGKALWQTWSSGGGELCQREHSIF